MASNETIDGIAVELGASTSDFDKAMDRAVIEIQKLGASADESLPALTSGFKEIGAGAQVAGHQANAFTSVVDELRDHVRQSSGEMRTWNRAMMELTHPMGEIAQLGRSLQEAFQGISEGNFGEAFSGITMAVKELAVAVPAVINGLKILPDILSALAPLGAALGAIGAVVAGVGAIVYEGYESWKAYKESIQQAGDAVESLNKAILVPAENQLSSTNQTVAKLTEQLQYFGMSANEISLAKANAEYEKATNTFFGMTAALEQQVALVQSLNGEDEATVIIEQGRMDVMQRQNELAREQMEASSRQIALVQQLQAAEAKAAAAREAALAREQAAREEARYVQEMSQWGNNESLKMDVQTPQSQMADLASGFSHAIEEMNNRATEHTEHLSAAMDTTARQAAMDYTASLGDTMNDFDYVFMSGGKLMGGRFPKSIETFSDLMDAAWEATYNAAADTFGAQVVSDVLDFAGKIGHAMALSSSAIGDALSPIGDALLSIGRGLADAIGSSTYDAAYQNDPKKTAAQNAQGAKSLKAQQDFQRQEQAGTAVVKDLVTGNWIQALTDLLSRSKVFGNIVAFCAQTFGKLLTQVEPLMTALEPLIVLVAEIGAAIADALLPILTDVLVPVFHALFTALKAVAEACLYVVKGLADAWNWIIDAVDDALGWMGVDLSSLKISTSGLNDALNTLKNTTIDSTEAQAEAAGQAAANSDATDTADDGLDTLGSTADSVSDSLTNVPAGYKVDLARFNATAPSSTFASNSQATTTNNTSIGQVTVVASADPKKTWADIKRVIQRENTVRTGSPILATAPAFNTVRPFQR